MAKVLGIEPLIHPAAQVAKSQLGRYTEVGARTSLLETTLDDYSYIVNDGEVAYTRIGRFCMALPDFRSLAVEDFLKKHARQPAAVI